MQIDRWDDFDSSWEFIDFLANWTGEEGVLDMDQNKTLAFDQIDKDMDFIEMVVMMQSFQSYVEMPGIITETNSPSFKGNLVNWQVSGISFLFVDNTMIVESRIVNTWAYVVAGIVLLMLIVLLVIKAKK